MIRRMAAWAILAAAGLALSGCYTVLRAPGGLAHNAPESPRYTVGERSSLPAARGARDDRYGDRYDDEFLYDDTGYGRSYPVLGYGSGYGLFGFGSPFAYGPGLGRGYPNSRYASAYGPYGYGYDPYYTGGNTYVPPGYELVTRDELDALRDAARSPSTGDPVPRVDEDALRREQQQREERAWTQRTEPSTRKSTAGYRTPRSSSDSSSSAGSVSSGSSKSSSSSKDSGGDAAKRRKQRR